MNKLNEIHEHDDPELMKSAKEFVSEERLKGIKSALDGLFDDLMVELEDSAADNLSSIATNRAKRFLERVIEGDEKAAESLFEFGDSGRYREMGCAEGKPWSNLIHGSLFETSPVRLRRKIVEAHAEMLSNERIRDLESIVDGLSQQVRETKAELERCRMRL